MLTNMTFFQSEDEMYDFPLHSNEWLVLCSTPVQAGRTLKRHFQIFPSIKYSISSRWEETRVSVVQNVYCASMLCYPCTASWYATFHFLRAGEYSSNTRDTHMKARPHAEASPPPYYIHTRLLTHRYFYAPKSCALCTRLLTAEQSLHVQPCRRTVTSPFKTTFKTCCTTCHTVSIYKYCSNANNSVTVKQKYFPCSSFWNRSLAMATSDLQHNYSKFKARSG